jgi:cytochrome c biogenesis protein CcdA
MLDNLAKVLADAISQPVFGFVAAFLAGLISSLAPCTLTAIVLIVGFVGASKEKVKALASTISFFLGLTVTFVILGAIAQGLGFLFSGPIFKAILGLITFLMGLNIVGLIKIPMPSFSPKVERGTGAAGAFLLGIVTATVSAPCATPVLIAVLALASSSAQGTRGILLTTAYALGHWAPVLVAGITAGFIPSALGKSGFAKAARFLTVAMGIAIAATGAWIAVTSLIMFF